MKKITKQITLAVSLVLVTVLLRVMPHMPNVAPVAAVALLSGALFPAAWAWLVPITAMGASDVVIGGYDWRIMVAVYGSFVLMAMMGKWLKRRRPGRILAAAVGGSILFYLITNLAVWKFGGLYVQTWDGLILCYTYALPFFRVNLLGNLAYTAGVFGVVEIVLQTKAWLEKLENVSAIRSRIRESGHS
jgi:hypothetical protein